jgi:hypothetical protein
MNKLKKRKVRRSSGNTDIYHGPEPILIGDVTQLQFSKALTWYHYTQDVEKGHRWLIDWLNRDGASKSSIQCIKRLNPKRVVPTAFWMAKMLLNGSKFDKDTMKRFGLQVKEMINLGNKLKDPEEPVVREKPNIQERIKEKGHNVVGDLEEAYDNFVMNGEKFSLYDYLQKNAVSPQILGMIREYYNRVLEDLTDTNKEVKASFGRERLKQVRLLEEWMSDLDRYGSNRKATKVRKPRKKKEKLAVDVVKRIKYQKEFKPLKLVSVQPTEIVGTQQLWVYNTKYKQLTVFNAANSSGLSVKGTTVTGFAKEDSQTKRLRKPEEQVAKLLTGGKIILRKFMSDIKTKGRVPNGRINENCILLRSMK